MEVFPSQTHQTDWQRWNCWRSQVLKTYLTLMGTIFSGEDVLHAPVLHTYILHTYRCTTCSCSVVAKLLCYHVNDPGINSCEGYTTDLWIFLRYWTNTAFHPSEVGKWVSENTVVNTGSWNTRVAPVDHYW